MSESYPELTPLPRNVTSRWPLEARLQEMRLAASVNQLSARARVAEKQLASLTAVREPLTYQRGNGHSWLADRARVALNRGDGDGGVKAAAGRLARHAAEVDAELPRILEKRDAEARRATEAAVIGSRAELRALERFTATGGKLFGESRALSRTDGQGGYFVGPLWAVSEFVPYALAGRPFIDKWTSLPLPTGTDEIMLPQVKVGVATGAQAADTAAVATRDLQDSAVTGTVRTVAGIIDLPLVMLDQSPLDVDSVFLPMLLADYNQQLDGLALLGSSSSGQPNGIMPGGALGAAQLISLTNTNNGSSQQWAYGGTTIAGSMHYLSAQLYSKLWTYRAQPPTAWIVNPLAWALMCAAADQESRPLVPPGPAFALGDGKAIGQLHGVPVVVDEGVPVTFTTTSGGGGNPSVEQITGGQVAATAGTGTYSPVLLGKWDDCFVWESDYRLGVFREVESGSLNARIRLHNYVVMIPGRFVWGGSNVTFSGTNQGGGLNAGGAVSYAALSQMQTNSVLQSGTGF